MKKVLILGVNGFIGHHLSKRILETTDWEVFGMDMQTDRLGDLANHERMHFFEGDITINKEWVEYHVKKCDVILPLVAIATPATYVKQPLRVFELDFEANLPIVRSAVKYGKHLVFPSTSEVYGMCADEQFDPEESQLSYGPINKPRWIYACSKQLMDRVIWGYGMEGLNFTLFRPFNWIGPGLDSIYTPKEGSSRVVTQFLGHIVRGENISLVDGGAQKRAFTDIDDGIGALMKIIENKDGVATGKIYNIGNPSNNFSVRELANMMLKLAERIPRVRAERQGRATGRDVVGRLLRQRATRTSRTACRKSTTRCRNSAGSRSPPWTTRCARFSKRIAAMSAMPASWSSNRKGERVARIVLKIDVDTLRGTREGVPNLARLLDKFRRPGHVPLQPRARSHRLGAAARVPAGVSEEGVAHVGGRALRRQDADVWRAAAGAGHRPACRRRDARDP